MSFELVQFKPEHIMQMRVQAAQREWARDVDNGGTYGDALTAVDGGTIIGCGGLIELWPGRALAWVLLAEGAGPHMLRISRAILSRLGRSKYRRIEMVVDASFEQGLRWAHALGFDLETPQPMRKYLPNGNDAYLFAFVRGV